MGMECAAMTIEKEEVKGGRVKERGGMGGEGVGVGMVGAKRQLSEFRNWIEN